MADLPEGAAVRPRRHRRGTGAADRLGVFRSLRFEEAEEIAPDGSLPITVRVEDRRPRTIGFGGTLFDDRRRRRLRPTGCTATCSGRAEQLRFDAGVDGLGGRSNPDDYDYNLGVTFTKPGRLHPRHQLRHRRSSAQRVDYDTYRERSITASVGLSQHVRRAADRRALRADVSRARYEDDFGVRHFTIFGAARHAAPTTGATTRSTPRAATISRPTLQPFYEAEYGNPALRGTLEGRVYRGFGAEDQVVLAGRAQGRQLLRPRRRGKPAGPAVLRRRRRLGPRLCLPLDRRRDHPIARRGPVRRRRHAACSRARPSCATASTSSWGGGRLRRRRASSPRTRRSRGETRLARRRRARRALLHRRSASLRVDLATPLNPRDGRLGRRALHRHRTGVLKRLRGIARPARARRRSPRWRRTPAEPDSDNGFLLNLLENQLSAPGRQIRLSGVSGALSSRARIQRITISDRPGRLARDRQRRARLEPARAAARPGRRQPAERRAHRLAAPRRDAGRRPRRLPSAEAKPFALPRAAGVDPGRASSRSPASASTRRSSARRRSSRSTASLEPRARRARHHARHPAPRRPRRQARRSRPPSPTPRASSTSTCDLQEPQGGVVATLLRIEGAPAIDLSVAGLRPARPGRRHLRARRRRSSASPTAWSRCARATTGLGFDVDFSGGARAAGPADLPRLLRRREHGAGQRRQASAAGGLRIDTLSVAGAVLDLDGGLETGTDGFLRSLTLTGTLGDPRRPGGRCCRCPAARTSLHSAVLHVDYGDATPLERPRGARPAAGRPTSRWRT